MYSRILLPLDGSKLAEAALHHASAMARRFQASLLLLEVVTPATFAATMDSFSASPAELTLAAEAEEISESSAEEYLAEVAHRPELKGIPVQTEVVEGLAAEEIIRIAKASEIDLIVMSTHGRSGIRRLVFGSVADQVLREAGLPILLIRPMAQHGESTPDGNAS